MWRDFSNHTQRAPTVVKVTNAEKINAPWEWSNYIIINNSAPLTKYGNYDNHWKCPIPSIIDPQSVCGKNSILFE